MDRTRRWRSRCHPRRQSTLRLHRASPRQWSSCTAALAALLERRSSPLPQWPPSQAIPTTTSKRLRTARCHYPPNPWARPTPALYSATLRRPSSHRRRRPASRTPPFEGPEDPSASARRHPHEKPHGPLRLCSRRRRPLQPMRLRPLYGRRPSRRAAVVVGCPSRAAVRPVDRPWAASFPCARRRLASAALLEEEAAMEVCLQSGRARRLAPPSWPTRRARPLFRRGRAARG